MKFTIEKILLIIIAASFAISGKACRFTVREIGFSILGQTNYSLFIVDENADPNDLVVREIREIAKLSNVQVHLINPNPDLPHPFVNEAKEKGYDFPNAFLWRSDREPVQVCMDGGYSLDNLKSVFLNEVMDSPMRRRFMKDIATTFAYVIFIDGKDSKVNDELMKKAHYDCQRIEDIMPLMPKTVEKSPEVLQLPVERFSEEKYLLWSLGADLTLGESSAVVIYGKGRFMGKVLDEKQIRGGLLYKYLAMIGADCECNLDRKWMLGTQIPLLWNMDVRQKLASTLGFDVDNPMILAEMSRILAKEDIGGGSVSFTPETINLDEAFVDVKRENSFDDCLDTYSKDKLDVIFYTLVGLLFISILFSFNILKKKKY